MQMPFTTLVKHLKKVFQGLFCHAVGGMRSFPGVAWCWVACPLSYVSLCRYPGWLSPPSQ